METFHFCWLPHQSSGKKYSLVVGATSILKNMEVNGKDDNPYMKWKITHV